MTRPYSPPRGVGHSPLQSTHSQIQGVRGGGRELTSSFIPVGADVSGHPPIASLTQLHRHGVVTLIGRLPHHVSPPHTHGVEYQFSQLMFGSSAAECL
jgi:hypothetical protein